ncbi:MAG: hypothetical protein FJZ58_02790 [Chlamydiae bacterium]|nr:hypothetical protein [Chlamydiota bacterium]
MITIGFTDLSLISQGWNTLGGFLAPEEQKPLECPKEENSTPPELPPSKGDLTKRASTQCDLLILGASRLTKVALVYKLILGKDLQESYFYEIHAQETGEKGFTARIFKKIEEHLDMKSSLIQEGDNALVQSTKMASLLAKKAILLTCYFVYGAAEAYITPYIQRRITALKQDLLSQGGDLVKHKQLLLDKLQDFLVSYIRSYQNVHFAQEDISSVDTKVKTLLENPELEINAGRDKKVFAEALVELLIPILDGGELLSYIPESARLGIYRSCGLIGLVEGILQKLETCLRDPEDKTTYALDGAITGILQKLHKSLTTPDPTSTSEALTCTVAEKQQIKDVINLLYRSAQYARCKTKEDVSLVFEKQFLLSVGEQDWSVKEEYELSTLLTPTDDLLKAKILDPWIDANAGLINHLVNDLLKEEFFLQTLGTSLENLNGLLFAQSNEIPMEEKQRAQAERKEWTKEVLDTIVHKAVGGVTSPYRERVEQWSSSLIGEKATTLIGGYICQGVAMVDRQLKITDRVALPFENLIEGVVDLIAAPATVPTLARAIGNKVLPAV